MTLLALFVIAKLRLLNMVVAWSVAAIWIVHLVEAARGMPKVAEITLPKWDIPSDKIVSCETGKSQPMVTIVVPARNEAAAIEPALRSLRALDYPNYEIVVVNDRSSDATGEIAERIAAEANGAPVKVLHVSTLPDRWLGKTHAMSLGARAGTGEWVLFTDADVVFRADALRRALAYSEREAADHLVLFPTMVMFTKGERMMVSLFQALIGFGHRPWKVADPDARDYIGVGAFNLIRRSVYEKIGSYERLRLAVLDDMQLGQMVKKCRFRQHCVFGTDLARIHWAPGAIGMVRNVTKNFFAYMRYSVGLAVGAAVVMVLMNVLPFVMIFYSGGAAFWGYLASLLCILALYAGMSPRSGIGWWYFVTHPISSSIFAYAILLSTFITLKHGGVEWRGTLYPLRELKKAME